MGFGTHLSYKRAQSGVALPLIMLCYHDLRNHGEQVIILLNWLRKEVPAHTMHSTFHDEPLAMRDPFFDQAMVFCVTHQHQPESRGLLQCS